MIFIWLNIAIIIALLLIYIFYIVFFEEKLFLNSSIRTDLKLFYFPLILLILNFFFYLLIDKNFSISFIICLLFFLISILSKRLFVIRNESADKKMVESIKKTFSSEVDYADINVYLQRILARNNHVKVIIEVNEEINLNSNELNKIINLKNKITSEKNIFLEVKFKNLILNVNNQVRFKEKHLGN